LLVTQPYGEAASRSRCRSLALMAELITLVAATIVHLWGLLLLLGGKASSVYTAIQ
jgi:hypothetical protein